LCFVDLNSDLKSALNIARDPDQFQSMSGFALAEIAALKPPAQAQFRPADLLAGSETPARFFESSPDRTKNSAQIAFSADAAYFIKKSRSSRLHAIEKSRLGVWLQIFD
jgi:hypothetical protein